MLFSLVQLAGSSRWPKCRSKCSALNTRGRETSVLNRGSCLLPDEYKLNALLRRRWCVDLPRRKILAIMICIY